MASPTKGIKGVAEASVATGDGSFRNVRLHEENGVRTMTISSAKLEVDDPNKTQRELDRYKKLGGYWVITFPYELRNNILSLKRLSHHQRRRLGSDRVHGAAGGDHVQACPMKLGSLDTPSRSLPPQNLHCRT
jgi:hypothetical protein